MITHKEVLIKGLNLRKHLLILGEFNGYLTFTWNCLMYTLYFIKFFDDGCHDCARLIWNHS